MASINHVTLLGNLTRNPELKYTPSGTAVATLGLAVNRDYVVKGGEKRKEVLFINVVVWAATAEAVQKYLEKGSQVAIEGRLQSRSWEKDGVKRTAIEVVADNVQFISFKKKAGDGAPPDAAGDAHGDDEVPF